MRITLQPPLEHQCEFLANVARFKVAACGRRWGKTWASVLAALVGHGTPDCPRRGAIQGGRIWWVAPSYPQIVASGVWRELKRACEPITHSKNEVDKEILLQNGGSIAVRSADNPSSLRGPGLDGVVMDEAAFMKPEVWHEAVRPSLADKNGWAILITTPNGQNWFHDLHQLAMMRLDQEYHGWQRPSSDNPLVTAEELDSIRHEIGDRAYSQEHLAEFMAMSGAEWPSDYFTDIYADYWPDRYELSCVAIDPSKGRTAKSDPSGIVFAGLSGGRLFVDATIAQLPVEWVAREAVEMACRYDATCMALEGNQMQDVALIPMLELQWRQRGRIPLPTEIYHNTTEKRGRILTLGPHLRDERIRLKVGSHGAKLLEQQLRGFPLAGVHDDGPDALEMAIRTLVRYKTGTTQRQGRARI